MGFPSAGSPQSTGLRDAELPVVDARPVDPPTERARRFALTALLIFATAVVVWIAKPLWVGILFGMLMAFTAQPAYRRLSARFGGRRMLASSLVVAASGAVVICLAAFGIWLLVRELIALAALLEQRMATGTLSGMVGERAARLVDKAGLDRAAVLAKLREELGAAAGFAATAAGVVAQAATSAVLGIMVALITMYYVLLEWRTLAMRLERILPLDPRHTRALILEFRDVGRGALVGTLAAALVQGALGAVAYVLFRVPHPVTWTVVTILGSFLPVLGTGVGWGPPGIYLILHGRVAAGAAVLLWGFVVVMTGTDYVIRPRLVGRRMGHPLLVLVALLGGLEVLGLPGLIVAPVIMSLFVAVLRIYEREVASGGPNRRDVAAS